MHGQVLGRVVGDQAGAIGEGRNAKAGIGHAFEGADEFGFGPLGAGIDHAFEAPAEILVITASEAAKVELDTVGASEQAWGYRHDVLGARVRGEFLDGDRGLAVIPGAAGDEERIVGVDAGQG